jgi:23S rRNA (guanosine2251-2'-O)-methyltransferase
MMHKQPKSNLMVYGIHPTLEALRAHKSIDRVLLRKGIHGEYFQEIFQQIREEEIPFQYVPNEKLNRLTRGNHQGIICLISPIQYEDITQIVPFLFENGKTPLLLCLDKVTDVRNLGAIARTAVCAGVDAILIPSKNTARINEDAIKASSGAIHTIPICRHHNLPETLTYLKESGIELIACTEKCDTPYYGQTYDRPLCVVMGSEGEGITPAISALCDRNVCIPMAGEIESLNVSVATGILLFEILRQRTVE